MPVETYADLNDEFARLYAQHDYQACLDLLTSQGDRFPEEAVTVLYLRSCMAARTGDARLAVQILRDALDRGYWYGEQVIRRSPSWQPLQGTPDFEEVAARSIGMAREAVSGPRLFVGEPEGGCSGETGCPLLIALHGNVSTGEAALEGWRDVTSQGWLLAAVQSSQAGMANAYVWDDQDVALGDLQAEFEEIRKQYGLDAGRVVLAGFSLGGETALRAALAGTVPVRGFILLGPGGPTVDAPEEFLPLIKNAAGKGLRGYIFLGENDDAVMPDAIRSLMELLNENGIPCEIEMVPGIRHEYPQDFGPRIARALRFIEDA